MESEGETTKKYDNCLISEIRNELDKHCTLPFLCSNKTNVCRSFKDGIKALVIYNKETTMCKFPNYQIDVDFILNPSQPISSITNPNIKIVENPGYYFRFPKEVKVSQTTQNYGFITYIAEFGGWSGLFIGISLLSITCQALTFLDSETNKFTSAIIKSTKTFIIIGSSLIVIYVACSSVIKLTSNETGQETKYQTKYSGLSLAICRQEEIFLNRTTFLGNNINFWKRGSNISNIIDYITFYYSNGSRKVLRNLKEWKDGDKFPHSQVKIQNILQINNVLFCQTLNIDDINYIRIYPLKEIFLYIFMNQQFHSTIGKTRITPLPENSISTKKKRLYIHETLTTINLIYNEYVKDISEPYDICFLKHVINSKIENVLKPVSVNDIDNGIDQSSFDEVIKNFYEIRNLCPNPSKNIEATYETKILEKKRLLDTKRQTTFLTEVVLSLPNFSMDYKE